MFMYKRSLITLRLTSRSLFSGYEVRRVATTGAKASAATQNTVTRTYFRGNRLAGLAGNSYQLRDTAIVRDFGRPRGMATTTTGKDEGFSPGSKVELPNGVLMPRIHFGVYEVEPGEESETAVLNALEVGYRAVDSAQWYENEASCGKAINLFLAAHPGLCRADIFFTTKLKNNVSYDDTRKNIKDSLEKTGLGYIDLYLIHSPYGGKRKRLECWRAVADAVEEGEVRVGGVSNFGVRHLRELFETEKDKERRPAVNQIEVHPFNTNTDITTFCRDNGILIQAYAPLAKGSRFNHPVVKELSKKYGCTPAQLLVRWSLQMGYVPLPKSVRKERMEENKNVEGFEITDEDMKRLEGLDERLVTDWDPTNAP